jgi:glucose/arabinose dehydrogenase
MLKHIRNLSLIVIVLAIGLFWYFSRPDVAVVPLDQMVGPKPVISAPRPQILPTMKVAEVERWKAAEKPAAASGLKVALYAADLDHPRNMLALPNGDILVAETNAPPRSGGGIKGWVERRLMTKAGAGVPAANRITLLRDGDGDGVPELRQKFLTGLNSPFGMALVGDTLYVANTDAVLAFPYKAGDTQIAAKGKQVFKLNAAAPNMHWTRNLVASADGKKLYIAVGSNSNIAENGREAEKGRAMIIELELATGKAQPYVIGTRNPVGLAWDNQGRLWTTVNERDMLGSDLVPDYLAIAEFAADYGWPEHYWGGFSDFRVKNYKEKDDKRQYERRPDYALGVHVAPLGLAFADNAKLGVNFASGAFVARHGSWNREPMAGYDVIFVPFVNGRPVGKPAPVLTEFLNAQGKARGRPAMLAVDKSGALLVSDDVGNRIWRVTAEGAIATK